VRRPAAARHLGWSVGAVSAVLGIAVAGAASLGDFREAESKVGCESIPYSSTRDTCKSKSTAVEEYCKGGRGKWSCDDLNPDGLRRQIENVRKKVEELEIERDDLSRRCSSSTDEGERRDCDDRAAAKSKEIDELKNKLVAWQRNLDDESRAIVDRLYVGERCLGAREDVASAFQSAKSSARSETDEEIRPFALRLIERYEREEPGHAKAIADARAGVDRCKAMR
jgi:hypothetical protein